MAKNTYNAIVAMVPDKDYSTAYSTLNEQIKELDERVGDIDQNVSSMLYNLHVDNTYSSYVKLSLSPDEYTGNSHRTIHIETLHSSFNPETGEVTVPGIPDITTICNIYTYASSWQFLGYDE